MGKIREESLNLDIRQRNISNGDSESFPEASINSEDRDKEKKLLRKIDWRIVPWIFCLYFLSVEDRSNVGYAMTMNKAENHTLADTAGLTPQQNNIGLGLFYVAYIVRTIIEILKLSRSFTYFFFPRFSRCPLI